MSQPTLECVLIQTHHALADFQTIRNELMQNLETHQKNAKGFKILIYPELVLCGYPLQDLCLQKFFYHHYQRHLEILENKIASMDNDSKIAMLLGGIHYEFDHEGIPTRLYNVLYLASPGQKLQCLYRKILLPNYDIFDEKKYFTSGEKAGLWQWNGFNLGLLICEDMWATPESPINPCDLLEAAVKEKNVKLDAIINCSASPFYHGKAKQRVECAKKIAAQFNTHFIYVNRVGAEDEILFDGQSFVTGPENLVCELALLKSDQKSILLSDLPPLELQPSTNSKNNSTWNNLFKADLDENAKYFHPVLRSWSDAECKEVVLALQFGLQEYARKCGMKNFLVALSGGIDSGLVLTLAKLCLKPEQQIEAIFMPGLHSTELSYNLAQELCSNLNINLKTLPIKFLHSVSKNLFREHIGNEVQGNSDENLQSRLRGLLLYTRSNQTGSMVINTSNKSELSVGYSTQYGDSVGAISLIGDLYKGQVYRLCEYLNLKHNNLIPKQMIERAPSAELRPKQTDEESLIPYAELDPLLECILSYRFDAFDLVKLGFNKNSVNKILQLYSASEFKRRQFCPIIKIQPKSFGFGYRVPICKNSSIYTIID